MTQSEPISDSLIQLDRNATKGTISEMAKNIVKQHLDNGLDIIQTADLLSKIELLIKEIKGNKDYVEYVVEQIGTRGVKGKLELTNGTKMEFFEVGTKYDYEVCGDSLWEKIKTLEEDIVKQKKEREEFLKKVPKDGMDIFDAETGEVKKIFPPNKTSTSSYKVTLAK